METSSQLKVSRFMSSAVNMMEPFRMHRRTGMSVQPSKSALMRAATWSMAFSISSGERNGLNVLSRSLIFFSMVAWQIGFTKIRFFH